MNYSTQHAIALGTQSAVTYYYSRVPSFFSFFSRYPSDNHPSQRHHHVYFSTALVYLFLALALPQGWPPLVKVSYLVPSAANSVAGIPEARLIALTAWFPCSPTRLLSLRCVPMNPTPA